MNSNNGKLPFELLMEAAAARPAPVEVPLIKIASPITSPIESPRRPVQITSPARQDLVTQMATHEAEAENDEEPETLEDYTRWEQEQEAEQKEEERRRKQGVPSILTTRPMMVTGVPVLTSPRTVVESPRQAVVLEPRWEAGMPTGGRRAKEPTYRTRCDFDCEMCNNQTDPLLFCIMDCKACGKMRKEKTNKDASQLRRINATRVSNVNQGNPKVMGDHYYYITLTAKETDGDKDYVIEQLVKSFRKMFPRCTHPKSYVYVIEMTEQGVPHLHGMIRYTGDYAQCPTSKHFKHKVKVQSTGNLEEREEERYRVVVRITEKVSGGGKGGKAVFATKMTGPGSIVEKWDYICKEGEIEGRNLVNSARANERVTLEDFL